MIYGLDFTDEQGMDTDVDAITCVLTTAYNFTISLPLQTTSQDKGSLRLLAAIFGLIEQSLTFVEYVHRAKGKASNAMELLHRIMAFGDKFSTRVMNPSFEGSDPDIPMSPDGQVYDSVHCSWQDTLDFATRNLSDSLARAPQRTWDTDLENLEVESMRVVAAVEMFRRSYDYIMRGYVVHSVVDGYDSDVDDEAGEEEQEMQRLNLDQVMEVLQELGWQGLM
jgi:hypothetical protein